MSSLYRETPLGKALDQALDQLVENAQIPPDLAIQTLKEFDHAMVRALEERVTAKAVIKGHLATYRYCDNLWDFALRDVHVRLFPTSGSNRREEAEFDVNALRIVVVDAKVVAADHAES